MKFLKIFGLLFISWVIPAAAQTNLIPFGARAMGLGNTSSCLREPWSLFNNVSGLAGVKNTSFTLGVDVPPSLPGANRASAVIALPFSFGTPALGISHFGDALYSEQTLSAGFANQLGLASLGVRINYVQYNAEGFGRKGVITLAFGGIAQLTPVLSVGAHIYNLNQPELSQADDDRLPAQITIGAAYQPGSQLFITAEIEKNMNRDPLFRAGIEYKPGSGFSVRTGLNINPTAAFLGIGLTPGKWLVSYAYGQGLLTINRHAVSISYKFGMR